MIGAVRNSLALLARLLLSLRYRIRVTGMERLKNLRGPILILPNHPAFIDPPIVLTTLYPRFHPRPLLFEGNFQNPFMRFMTYLLDSLKVP
ncbi:MAG: 1-acyl-sn-glycerol-3-phosphate acyltransferase, partial [Gemmataceae bacterium]